MKFNGCEYIFGGVTESPSKKKSWNALLLPSTADIDGLKLICVPLTKNISLPQGGVRFAETNYMLHLEQVLSEENLQTSRHQTKLPNVTREIESVKVISGSSRVARPASRSSITSTRPLDRSEPPKKRQARIKETKKRSIPATEEKEKRIRTYDSPKSVRTELG